MIIIGKNPVLELLRTSPKDFNKIILLKTLKPEPKLLEIRKLADANKVPAVFLNKYDFENYFNKKNKQEGISQGVLGFIKDFEYTTLKDIIESSKSDKSPLIVLLDEITDPQNMGAIIRSAVCLGANGIVIPRHNSAEVNHTVIKASSGAVNHIKIAKETNFSNAIKYLKDNGYWVAGADVKTDKFPHETNLNIPVALIIGSEGHGIRPALKEKCDILLKIPMTGKIDSLNASVSAGILLYEILRQKQ